ARLQSQFMTHRAGSGCSGSAEPAALVADDGFHCREQFRGGHDSYGHAGATEDGFDYLAMTVAWYQHAVLNIVSTHNAAGGHTQIENRIAGRGELVNHLLRSRAAVKRTRVALFQDNHATTLDALIARIHGGSDEVRKADVGDETAALFYLQHGFFPRLPFDDTD